jgi:hypothetical protein
MYTRYSAMPCFKIPSSNFLTIVCSAASPSVRAAGPGCRIIDDLILGFSRRARDGRTT